MRPKVAILAFLLAALCLMGGCGGGGAETSGPEYSPPKSVATAAFSKATASANGAQIDASHVEQGYVAAKATSKARLKLQIICGQASYNYDLPGGGTAIVCPLNMGNGTYQFRVMRNTSGSNYVEIASTSATVSLESEFAPYLVPNLYANYSKDSECVALAQQLAEGAENEGDVVKAVYEYIVDNISYDNEKAARLKDVSGYEPDPDETLASGSGICLDYSSLAASMLRSLGIPCKIVTGYVSPDNIYHAWNLVYINSTWTQAEIQIDANTWSLIDTTFAAGGASSTTGDGQSYTQRYEY